MSFSRKRGRPKKNIQDENLSIKESYKKRNVDNNLKTLDILLKYNLITEEEFNAGMHFHWLYTVIFGSPKIKAYNFEKHYKNNNAEKDCSYWLYKRQKEYRKYIKTLEELSCKNIAIDLCIFDARPYFITDIDTKTNSQKRLIAKNHTLLKLREAFKKIIKEQSIIKRSYIYTDKIC